MMSPSFWQGKKVFLTGHTGFKGSWLSIWLQMLGVELVGYSLAPPSHPSLFDVAHVSDKMTSLIGDIRDAQALKQAVETHQPDIVIHFAAQSLVRESYQEPLATFDTNIMGTANLLEACRHTNAVKAILIVTSDKCYQNNNWAWGYRESDTLGGYDPYSNSKACAELVTSCYRDAFFSQKGPAIATARAGNVIGGGDWAKDRLLPDLIHSIQNDKAIELRNPMATRPWQHVLDPLNGYLMLIEKLYQGDESAKEGWNFGPNEANKSVEWIAQQLAVAWGKEAHPITSQASDASMVEAHSLKLDSSKANTILNWQQMVPTITALEWIQAWHEAFVSTPDNMRRFTEQQIETFCSL